MDAPGHFEFSTLQSSWMGDSRTGYDVVAPKTDRRNRRPTVQTVFFQDSKLRGHQRQEAIGTVQDIEQNFAVVSWAVRKHLDYVSSLSWMPDIEPAVNKMLKRWFRSWGSRLRCDTARRHPFRRFVRLGEARRCVDGDMFYWKRRGRIPNRGRLTAIEAYRVEDPFPHMTSTQLTDHGLDANLDADRWVNGVEVNGDGAAIRYAIFDRTIEGELVFNRFIPARDLVPLSYYQRFDQYRGISPLMSGILQYIDVHDGIDLYQAKMRVCALFGISLYRDVPTSDDNAGGPHGTEDADEDGIKEQAYEWDLSGGPKMLDFDDNSRAEVVESRTPPEEAVSFMRFMLNIALKTLDLPDSFLREGETNFFGSRAALQLYLKACQDKQDDLREALDEILAWRLGLAIRDEEISLPRGLTFDDVQENWEWAATGYPWAWDPDKEQKGLKGAIELGIDNVKRASTLLQTDIEENRRINLEHFSQYPIREMLPWMKDGESAVPEPMEDEEPTPSAD